MKRQALNSPRNLAGKVWVMNLFKHLISEIISIIIKTIHLELKKSKICPPRLIQEDKIAFRYNQALYAIIIINKNKNY